MSTMASHITGTLTVSSTVVKFCAHHKKKTSKLRVTGLRDGNPRVIGGFPSQKTSNAENAYVVMMIYPKQDAPTRE